MLSQEGTIEQVRLVRQKIREYYVSQGQRAYSDQVITLTPLFSLTNDVFRVDVDGKSTLFKIYKPSLPEFTNNSLEILIITKLAQQNFYPQILHYTKEYRIEQFIEGNQSKLRSLSQSRLLSIVSKLAHFSSRYSSQVQSFHSKAGTLERFNLQNLLQVGSSIYESKKQQCPAQIQQCSLQIEQVFSNQAILNNLSDVLSKTPRVLCHNDCHIGNLLITSSREYILDFEFANYNYAGYDLGNFLNEWATQYEGSFEIREDLEMDKELQDNLIKVYFDGLATQIKVQSYNQRRYLVQLGRVLSHLFWMIIGVKQIDDVRIGFSMVYYIRRRKQQFLRHFGELLRFSNDF